MQSAIKCVIIHETRIIGITGGKWVSFEEARLSKMLVSLSKRVSKLEDYSKVQFHKLASNNFTYPNQLQVSKQYLHEKYDIYIRVF